MFCCNYDCDEKLNPSDNLYNSAGFVYCNEMCASNHWYDIKKERRRAFQHAVTNLTYSAVDAHKYADKTISENVAAYQSSKR